jgi:hypothetical protein
VTETRIAFVGGSEIRVHEDMETVRIKLASANGSWAVLDRGGTKHLPVTVNPANVAYMELVPELEPEPEEHEPDLALTQDYETY